MNKSDKTKNQLIQAVIELLRECYDISELTSRKITEKAKINLSTINYHFGSKDELVNIAVNKLIEEVSHSYFKGNNAEENPRNKLKSFLISICDMVVDYRKYTKDTIPYILLQGKFNEAIQILPLVKACFEEGKSDEECKIISYQLISFLQLVFYRSDEFKLFSGVNIMNKEERDRFINMQTDLLIR